MFSITVNTLVDENDGVGVGGISLREAIAAAPANSEILFSSDLFGGEIQLTNGELSIASNVEITGPGAELLTVRADSNSRVISVGSGVSATIEGLTLTGGDASGYGGGISNAGSLQLTEVEVIGNYADYDGGGIYVSPTGTLSVDRSTIDDNESGTGGGGISGHFKTGTALTISNSTISNNVGHGAGGGGILYYSNSGGTTNVAITNTTISGNTAAAGGAIQFQNAVGTTITASIVNSTIAYNTATTWVGGGIFNLNGANVTMHNTILAQNTSVIAANMDWGGLAANGASSYNLIGQVGGTGLTHNNLGNKVGSTGSLIDPLLGALADNGGPTKTHALLTGSDAINSGDNDVAEEYDLLFDQRGKDRTDDDDLDDFDVVDIGAFELAFDEF